MSTVQDPKTAAKAWYARYRKLRLMLALVVGAIALIFAAVMWFATKALSINPGKGTPIGWSVRIDGHVATLIQTLEPYIPSPNRNHGNDTYSIGIFLVPLDGSKPRLVPISGGHKAGSLGLVQILGSDGYNMWFDANAVGAVDFKSYELLTGADLRDAPPSNLKGALPNRLSPRIEASLSTGFFINDNEWFGVLSPEEAQGEYAPKKWLRRITHAESLKRMRRFHRGTLGDSYDDRRQIVAMEPIDDIEYLNAAFLRFDDKSEPFRMQDPDGALMLHTSEPGMKGTLMVSRVGTGGRIIWQVDTEIDRFKLSQILPGEDATAFIGTRLPIPNKVPEPLLVIVEHNTGKVATHSMWQ
ncbi:MAG: hypothetical protein IPJ85_04520 [Flavobacteriales bacterium]|nr:hypothetical protein [Flavobacteriales bacterium]